MHSNEKRKEIENVARSDICYYKKILKEQGYTLEEGCFNGYLLILPTKWDLEEKDGYFTIFDEAGQRRSCCYPENSGFLRLIVFSRYKMAYVPSCKVHDEAVYVIKDRVTGQNGPWCNNKKGKELDEFLLKTQGWSRKYMW